MQTKGTRVLTRICFLAMLVGVADAATLRDLMGGGFKQDRKLDITLSALADEAGVQTRTQQAQSSALQEAAGRLARFSPAGAVQVYVRMQPGFPPMESVLSAAGLNIEVVNTKFGIVQGWIEPTALEALSQLSSVSRVTVPDYAFTRTGSINTEGDDALRASNLRAAATVDGADIRVGVISDGVDSIADVQPPLGNDLPAVVYVTPAFPGSGDEGTAMLEIIHDLAPGAELGFCGPATSVEFIQCVQDLQTGFGADIIVDDLGFPAEPYFEDGMVAQAVAAVPAAIDYVSAAGNSAAGNYYEADFTPSNVLGFVVPEHNFGIENGGANDPAQTIILGPGETACAILQWNDPFGSSGNDYDLFMFSNDFAAIRSASAFTQDGDDDPIEGVFYTNPSATDSETVHIAVLQFMGANRRLKLFVRSNCNRFTEYFNAEGSIFGHPAVPRAVAVGTINVFDTGLNTIASYSSRGPVRIDFPGPVTLRPKPDLTGVDCGSITGAGGFGDPIPGQGPNNRFCGTSAAAPHVAGVLALLRDAGIANPVQALKDAAVDLGAAGRDDVYGFGRVTAALLASIDVPADDISITVGQSVNFAGSCHDPIFPAGLTLSWGFSDGTMSTSPNPPSQTYNSTGTFIVTLTCTNTDGDTATAVRNVTVNAASGGGGGGGDDGGGGGGGGCFIATAAYGSYLHPRVQVLRDFRDQYLMTNDPGRAFVQWYYQVSPPMAEIIADNEMLRLLARGVLTPVVYGVQYPGLGAGLLLLGFIGLRGYRRVLRPEIRH
jgi:hypothetical protein